MPLMFNMVLTAAGVDPKDCRLLRHKENSAARGRGPYELWRDRPEEFMRYQSVQSIGKRVPLDAPFWAAFVVSPSKECLFAGLYSSTFDKVLEFDEPRPQDDLINKAGECVAFQLLPDDRCAEFVGRLVIDWGTGALAWVQHAHRNEKLVLELRRRFHEPEFPGFLNFIEPLSRLRVLPPSWQATLQASRGVYLLTCPRTKEQYVGSATGSDGFWGRWLNYIATGHGDNVKLKSRDPSDYQVSILEVAGSSASADDVRSAEGRWQQKLQSFQMGLNGNRAG